MLLLLGEGGGIPPAVATLFGGGTLFAEGRGAAVITGFAGLRGLARPSGTSYGDLYPSLERSAKLSALIISGLGGACGAK